MFKFLCKKNKSKQNGTHMECSTNYWRMVFSLFVTGGRWFC